MKKFQSILNKLFLGIYLVFMVICSYFFITEKLIFNDILWSILIWLILGVGLYLTRNKNCKFSNKIFIPLLIGAIFIYLFALVLNIKEPFSDYLTFYDNAKYFALHNIYSNPQYISVYPHLNGYIITVGYLMKILTTRYKVTILLNIIAIFIGGFIIYKIFKMDNNKNLSKIGVILWLYSPLNYVFIYASIPICFFQTFLLLSIYGLKKLETLKEAKKVYLMSIILGIIIGIANLYRPIMIVFLIAFGIYLLLTFQNIKALKMGLICFILMFIPYTLINKVNNLIVSKLSGYEVSSLPGWNIYVGSQGEDGSWQIATSEVFEKYYYAPDFTVQKFHRECLKEGIINYQNRNFKENLIFLKNKWAFLVRGMPELNVYIFNHFTQNEKQSVSDTIKWLTIIWCSICLAQAIAIMIKKAKNLGFNLFLALLVIGITLAHLLMEVNPRYFIPVYVPLLIMGLNNYEKKEEKNEKLGKKNN